MQKSFYEILEVDRDAGIDQIKKAYHRKILKLHPDKFLNPGPNNNENENQKNESMKNREEFMQVQEAWSILKDRKKKIEYDTQLRCELSSYFFFFLLFRSKLKTKTNSARI